MCAGVLLPFEAHKSALLKKPEGQTLTANNVLQDITLPDRPEIVFIPPIQASIHTYSCVSLICVYLLV
jgi:hypothetical protein